MSGALLSARGLVKRYGGLAAVDGVDLDVQAGEIKAVIGPNGAGKTTLFNCVSGVVRPTSGTLQFEERSIAGLAPHKIAQAGIARTWQTIRLFEEMTALENVLVGLHGRTRAGFLAAALRLPGQRREERAMVEAAMCQLDFLGAGQEAHKPVRTLPFLMQRRVELARALAAEPRLLCLDEPAAGLNTRETAELTELIRVVRRSGVTVLLVEHDMSLVMEISDSILVLDHGLPIAEGKPDEIRRNERVIAVYLGGEAA